MRTFDVVVVGAGPGGEVAAGYLAEAGLSVAVVEADKVGGECSFYACIPSKALLRPGELLAQARRVPGVAEAVTGGLDVAAVLRRRDELIGHLDDAGQVPWLEERGIALIRGRGRLAGERRVAITAEGRDEEVVEAGRAVILAGGTRATIPPIPGLAEAKPWTNREAVTAQEIPESLVIIGAGVVGSEMSQAYTALGSRVTLVGNVLPKEEDFAGEQVVASLREQGAEVREGVRAVGVTRTDKGVVVTLSDGASVSASEVLIAAGRTPQTSGLGLETVGVTSVAVDERMRIPGTEWLYAIGDLNGRALFTHMAKYQGRIAAAEILGEPMAEEHLADGAGSPRVIFTEPQVASVGHSTASAAAANVRVRVVDIPTDGNAGGSFAGGNGGTARFLVDEDRGVLAGVTITGSEIADFLHAATIAIVGEVPVRRLRHAVPSFPTRSEIWLKFFDAMGV
ncbi:NAD(P)/FAD-dependent oxidoreductase [Actinoplanes sp. NPDC023714]|uniref:dihydrolipoyl dehydrogenase family protein n=1 Tax=Actinoplanes sp. NPDC023714 TaxID=3154322 RepID=UPI0033CF5E2E